MNENLTAPANMTDPLIYLASPYSHESDSVREQRYVDAASTTTALIKIGRHVFSPIVFCHHLALGCSLPTDADFWEGYNKTMLKRSNFLYVLCTNGIDTSIGVHREIVIAETSGIPTLFLERLNAEGELIFMSPRKARVTWGVKI